MIKGMSWLLLLAGGVLAMPPLPSVKIPKELVDRYKKMGIDVAKKPVRDVNKAGRFNRGGVKIETFVSGTKNFPVVLMEYPDYARVYASTDFSAMLFGTWPSGSAHDYYKEVSYTKLDLDGKVYGWYLTDQNRNYYATNTGDLIVEAVEKSDPTVNYADYDNDADGYVDCFSVIHSGYGMEETGNPNDIWSHMYYISGWFGSPYITNDPDPNHPGEFIKVDLYTVEPERSNVSNNGTMVCIGVFCHEWGHALGLPDLYDTDPFDGNSGEGLGIWCLMASGCWGGDLHSPWSPVHLSVWAKQDLGWISPTVVRANAYYPVEQTETISSSPNTQAYKLWTRGEPRAEYFLIENRQRVGFDVNLPNSGLLIYHIDETIIKSRYKTNRVNAGGAYPYGVALEQADGQDHLWDGTNRGDANDPYPGGMNNTAFDSSGTSPDSRSNSGGNTQCGVNHIPVSDWKMTAYFYIGPDISDVGVVSINEPSDTLVLTDETYSPTGSVGNFGSVTATNFMVSCEIESAGSIIYSDITTIPLLSAHDTTVVMFQPWTVGSKPGLRYTITMRTLLANDTRPQNDAQSKTVTAVIGYDAQTVSIESPPDTTTSLEHYTPRATVKNNGIFTQSFPVYCRIESMNQPTYNDMVMVTNLLPNQTKQVSFKEWVAPKACLSTMTVFTDLTNDKVRSNDTISKSIKVLRIEEMAKPLPTTYSLWVNATHPGEIQIRYGLSVASFVSLRVFNVLGEQVINLVNEKKEAGYQSVRFSTASLPAGIYFVRLEANEHRITKKVFIIH